MIVDANLLIYARNADDPRNPAAREWVESVLNGPVRVGLPWESLTAFLRIVTNPRAFATPLSSEEAWTQIEKWLSTPTSWVPLPTPRHAEVLGELVVGHRVAGPLVSDAHLAALALEHGVTLCSTDADFARFEGLRWSDPLR